MTSGFVGHLLFNKIIVNTVIFQVPILQLMLSYCMYGRNGDTSINVFINLLMKLENGGVIDGLTCVRLPT